MCRWYGPIQYYLRDDSCGLWNIYPLSYFIGQTDSSGVNDPVEKPSQQNIQEKSSLGEDSDFNSNSMMGGYKIEEGIVNKDIEPGNVLYGHTKLETATGPSKQQVINDGTKSVEIDSIEITDLAVEKRNKETENVYARIVDEAVRWLCLAEVDVPAVGLADGVQGKYFAGVGLILKHDIEERIFRACSTSFFTYGYDMEI